jgi:hypothetical protein
VIAADLLGPKIQKEATIIIGEKAVSFKLLIMNATL